jgi:hypothetical protein
MIALLFWFTAALMLGAAVGGSRLGNLGDRIGRAQAMGLSVLFYSLFAGRGAFLKNAGADAHLTVPRRP